MDALRIPAVRRRRAATPAPDAPRPSLHDAAVAPVTEASRGTWRLVALLALPVLAAVVAYVVQLREGIGVTGLNDQVFWGVYTVDLVTFIGFSYGGALVSAILRLTNARWRGPIVRVAEGTALVTLLIGATFPIIHLGRPERLWQMVTRPQLESPVLWDMVAILTYLLVTVLLFVLPLIPDAAELQDHPRLGRRRARLYRLLASGWRGTPDQRARLERTLSVLAVMVIPVAIMVHTVLSYAFSLTSRPGWHSTIFGPAFVIAAVYSGVAIVVLATLAYRHAFRLGGWIPDRDVELLGYIMAALGAVYAYFLFTELTTEGYVGAAAEQVLLYELLLGRYAVLFWIFVATGIGLPLLLVALPRTRHHGGIMVAALSVIISMWLKRFLVIIPPMTRPLIGEGAAGAYVPSPVEITITVGAVAAVPLLLVLLFRVFPVLSVQDVRELDEARQQPHPARAVPATGGWRP